MQTLCLTILNQRMMAGTTDSRRPQFHYPKIELFQKVGIDKECDFELPEEKPEAFLPKIAGN